MNKHFNKFRKELAREAKEKTEGKGKVGDGDEQELGGYELYKRWEYYMEPRVYPSGDKSQAFRAVEEFQIYKQQNAQNRQGNNSIQSSTWQPLGPFGDPTGGNAGRINNVRFDPSVANGLWVATPDGGLWGSANNGGTWTTNTDFLSPIGCSDVAWDPTNSQNMYLATGDADANDSYSIGVLKSTNGGSTWSTTGMVWTTNQSRRIYKLLANPLNKNVLFAASNIGLYRTTNAGVTWNLVGAAGSYTDLEYKPGDTTTVYAVSTQMYGLGTTTFYKSTDGGATWSGAATGLPSSASAFRFAIAVTAANPAYVYLVSCLSSNYGFQGFYRSTNSGTSFTGMLTSSTPNLLGWASNGNDAASGGQGWYTLSIAASPTNANEVCVGGVNVWRTTNGGTTFSLFAHWTGSGAPFVHADMHDIEYKNGTTIYIGCDGGIFYTSNSGASFSAINGTMNIAQLYKMGNSTTTYSLAISGHQDNGTNIFTGGWSRTMGGDGMSAFIDWSNNSVMYGEQYQGSFNRSTNGGASWTGITTGLSGTGAWNTPWHQDPLTANTLYGGLVQMFKSTNQGTSWSQIGNLTGTNPVTEFQVAPSNSSVIYVIQGGTILWKTTNGGTSWTNITGTLPVGSAKMTFVAVKNNDPNSVWVTFSGYSTGNKVYNSTDGGTTWANYSTGLPNLPVNCITYWNNTKCGLYVGCDIGIYYRDSLQASWSLYNTGLPNVSVHDLAIFYPTGKIRAATYGRGMWEADLVNNGTQAPIANFAGDKLNICAGMTVNFTDLSTFGPTSWNWTFQSGTPATSTIQNPSIVYNTPGTYSVQLTATNGNGSNTATKTLYITVSPVNALPLVEGFQGATFPPTNWQNYDDKGDGLMWTKSATVGKGSTASTYYDNYNLDATGSRDEMRAPKYNFGGFSIIKLYFDVAYATIDPTLPQYNDTLAVMVSSDCGITWNQVYVKGGPTLASTATSYSTAIFTPTAAQWRTDTVYLNAYAGMGNVMVSFQNRGHYGQALYLDNINIAGSGSGAAPNAVFSIPATKCTGQSITFTDASTNSPTSWSWNFQAGSPATSTVQNPVVTYTAAGTYTVSLVATNGFGSSTPSTQTITITATPTVTATASAPTICSGQSTTLTGGGATNYTWTPGGITTSTVSVSPGTTTVYTVTGATGVCTASKTVSVSVNATPTITATAASSTLCAGQSTTLTGTGATNYTWSPGGASTSTVSINPVSSTTYTLTGLTAGCSATKTVSVSVTPVPTVTVNTANICAGFTATLTASGATTYSWSTGAATASISVTPPSTTVYTVTGTNNGCSGVNTATVNVYTNPTVTVNNSTICSGATTTLTASGAMSYSWNTGAATSSINVTPSSTTVYTVTGNTGGCVGTSTSTVTVNPTPTVNVNSASICSGNPTTLNASGATTYSWSPGTGLSATTGASVTSNPGSTTVYTITGTSGSCSSTSTSTVTVVANLTVTVNSTAICAGSTATLTAGGASTYTWSTGSTASSINVSPGSTTVYTVSGSSGSCNAANTATVTVNTLPNVTAAAGGTVCAGSPANLNAGGATTYTWNPGGQTGSSVIVNPAITTTYTVTGDNGTCTNTATTVVNVNALPGITATAVQDTICIGNSTSIGGGGGITYTWSPGTGLSSTTGANVTANPTVTITYTVSGTDANACVNTATETITVSGCTGLIKNSGNIQLSIYPNPNHGSFVIEIPSGNTETYNMEIHNALGQLVYQDKIKADGGKLQKTITLAAEIKGVLTFRISSSFGKQVYRIIVE
ncbi:MAG TPA: PKD domain-containing protein [Bacteroidia bacterium]|nr:PKD domain-containing protein [Bacteroidia bacterium]